MTEFNHKTGLHSLLAAIAASPIVVRTPQAHDFAEWCELQHADDIDTVILGWLRSQTRQHAVLS